MTKLLFGSLQGHGCLVFQKAGPCSLYKVPVVSDSYCAITSKKTSENTLPPSGKQIERQRRREEGRDSRYGGGIFESCCWSEEDEQGGSRTGRSESQLAKTQPVKNWIDLQWLIVKILLPLRSSEH